MKRKLKRLFLLILLLCVLFFLYVAVGAIAPYARQRGVAPDTLSSFRPEDCYGSGTGPDRVRIVEDNQEALELRIQMIRHAKQRVILSSFDFREDEAGLDMLAVLLDAADRGVQVQVFVDGFNVVPQMEGSKYFYALSSHPNATITVYNYVNVLRPWKLMPRMHDKYLIVDEEAYLLGGRNTFDYFLGSYGDHKNYDREMLVWNTGSEDSSLYQLRAYFEEITALDCCRLFHDRASLADKLSVKKAADALRARAESLAARYPERWDTPCDYAADTLPTHAVTLLSNPIQPVGKEPVLFYELMALCQGARKSVAIHTPYVMADDQMLSALAEIGSKGTMLYNSAANNDNPFAAVDYVHHKSDLLATGLQLHEYDGGVSYHGKSLTIDDELAIVGSFNMDMRSTYLDTELMLVVHSEEVTEQLRAAMEHYDRDAAVVETADTYRSTPHPMQKRSSFQLQFQHALGWALERWRFLL